MKKITNGFFTLLIIGVVLALSIGIIYFYILQIKIEKPDENFCLVEPTNIVAIVIDDTDEIDLTDKDDIKAIVTETAKKMPRFTKFDIYRVSQYDKKRINKDTFSRCSPLGSSKMHWFSDDDKVLPIKQKDFISNIETFIDKQLNISTKPQSPIMEMMKFAMVNSFAKYPNANKTVLLFSDLMQNSEFSFYTNGRNIDFDQFKKTAFARSVKTRYYKNTNIFIKKLTANTSLQNNSVDDLWQQFFEQQDALPEFNN